VRSSFIGGTVLLPELLVIRAVSPPGLLRLPLALLISRLLAPERAVTRFSDEVWDETLVEVLLTAGGEGPDVESTVLDSLDVFDIDLKGAENRYR